MSMFDPVKIGFGNYLARFFNDALVADTKALESFKTRPLHKAILMSPSRLIDMVDDMLIKYMKLEKDSPNAVHNDLPVIIFAIDRTFTPTGRSGAYQVADNPMVTLPNDPKERAFKLKTINEDMRAQVVIFAHDQNSARSIAGQLMLYADALANRNFGCVFRFSGIDDVWSARVESPDNAVMAIPSNAKNLTIMTVDLTIKAVIPIFEAPKETDLHDDKGDPNNPDDLAGWLMVDYDHHKETFLYEK
jgi:hypothetical protein